MTNLLHASPGRSAPASVRQRRSAAVSAVPLTTHAFAVRILQATMLLLLLPALLIGQDTEDPRLLIDRVQQQFDRVNDYSVSLRATVDMKGLSVPEMNARLYFKKPDRIHVESDGFAMLPRDAVAFRPTMFEDELYDMVIQGKETVRGRMCVKVRLFARSDTVRLQRAMLFVDPARNLILRAEIDPEAGSSAKVDMTYTRVEGKYWLPETIAVEMDSPRRLRRPGDARTQKKDGKDDPARITVRYSDYAVNRGIPDSVFEKKRK